MNASTLRQAQDSAGLSASAPLLEIKDLHVHFDVYGGTLRVLDGVNFVVQSGQRVGLVGETGCGKTTTMKSILRILPPHPPGFLGERSISRDKMSSRWEIATCNRYGARASR